MITTSFIRQVICIILLAGTLVFIQSDVQADEIQPSFVLGKGLLTCKTWTEHHHAGGMQHAEDIAWVFGFLSGYNEFDQSPKRPFLSQDETVIVSSIDRYCAASPDKHVTEVVIRIAHSAEKPTPTLKSKGSE